MADIFDLASDYESRDREAALSSVAGRTAWAGPPPDSIAGVACCAECGEPIPDARRKALPGVGLCVECAE